MQCTPSGNLAGPPDIEALAGDKTGAQCSLLALVGKVTIARCARLAKRLSTMHGWRLIGNVHKPAARSLLKEDRLDVLHIRLRSHAKRCVDIQKARKTNTSRRVAA